jgi:hypothetical protein
MEKRGETPRVGLARTDTPAPSPRLFALQGLGEGWLTRDRTVLAGSRRYPMFNFVYLLLLALLPLFLRTAKIAPPMTRPPNSAMITMGSTRTSENEYSFLQTPVGPKRFPEFCEVPNAAPRTRMAGQCVHAFVHFALLQAYNCVNEPLAPRPPILGTPGRRCTDRGTRTNHRFDPRLSLNTLVTETIRSPRQDVSANLDGEPNLRFA